MDSVPSGWGPGGTLEGDPRGGLNALPPLPGLERGGCPHALIPAPGQRPQHSPPSLIPQKEGLAQARRENHNLLPT